MATGRKLIRTQVTVEMVKGQLGDNILEKEYVQINGADFIFFIALFQHRFKTSCGFKIQEWKLNYS